METRATGRMYANISLYSYTASLNAVQTLVRPLSTRASVLDCSQQNAPEKNAMILAMWHCQGQIHMDSLADKQCSEEKSDSCEIQFFTAVIQHFIKEMAFFIQIIGGSIPENSTMQYPLLMAEFCHLRQILEFVSPIDCL